ncbi:DUF4192 domain-containing protein [Actinomadura roseirufa]|uniref:DUF4192 domain-containing protein n=1 Tax=Actinomadura roseirufa TaxID=2094049 RepID=UPI00104147C2|nr:DUF4192 domain-containing protein [Actinomadura roseirufa]
MTPLVIRTAEDAIAAVPYLLGFHPSRSLVVIGFDGPGHTCAVRLDLPAAEDAERASRTLAAHRVRRALLLGYGDPPEVAASASALTTALAAAGVVVAEAIRVADGRWWSLTCQDACCPPEGVRYDSSTSVLAAQATYAGRVVLPGRADLARSVQPLQGAERRAMREATDRAERRFLAWARDRTSGTAFQARTIEEGVVFVPALLDRAHGGARPTDDEVAWLGFLLTEIRVRDEAWIRIDGDDPAADIEFWRDIVRRVEEDYAAAPASLLAFAAYSGGDGGLAGIAVERALAADPAYSMAVILRELITSGIPPANARLSMTPQQLAMAYHETDTG